MCSLGENIKLFLGLAQDALWEYCITTSKHWCKWQHKAQGNNKWRLGWSLQPFRKWLKIILLLQIMPLELLSRNKYTDTSLGSVMHYFRIGLQGKWRNTHLFPLLCCFPAGQNNFKSKTEAQTEFTGLHSGTILLVTQGNHSDNSELFWLLYVWGYFAEMNEFHLNRRISGWAAG